MTGYGKISKTKTTLKVNDELSDCQLYLNDVLYKDTKSELSKEGHLILSIFQNGKKTYILRFYNLARKTTEGSRGLIFREIIRDGDIEYCYPSIYYLGEIPKRKKL